MLLANKFNFYRSRRSNSVSSVPVGTIDSFWFPLVGINVRFFCCLVSFWGYSAKVLRSYELEYVFGGFLKDFEKLEKREREYHVIVKSTSFPIGYSEKVQHFEKLPKVDLLEEQS